ncbi:MAG: type II toxin-antitoxin system MqsR family toxin [Geobacteraceae bacterium]
MDVSIANYTTMVYKIPMADKRKPTYDLDAFKATFASVERLAVTGTALRGAAALGYGRSDIVATIQTMQRGHFYKSMTSYADTRLWQDVYHVPSPAGVLYVKFTADVITEFLLLSFKEKNND